MGFLRKIVPLVHEKLIKDVSKIYSHVQLQSDDTLFITFPGALEAIDVTLQYSCRPSGIYRRESFPFRKHHLYGYEKEVCVGPNGLRPLSAYTFRDQSRT